MKNHKKVIQFPVPANWRFFDWVQGNSSPIRDWYENDLSDAARLLFDGLLKVNHKTELPIRWVGFKRFLEGKQRQQKIWELQFYSDGRQYRVLGVFGETRKQAVIILGCYHKGQVYTPANALDTAYKRAKDLSEGRAGISERTIKIDI